MLRDVDINEISDGQLYHCNDMVKISCNDCRGCSECCHNMGDSINLDPYDIYMLEVCLGKNFEELLARSLDLHIVDGNVFPYIKMQEDTKSCIFLSTSGRCTIHDYRPGFCRLFPLGRIYEGDEFSYFNQIHECSYSAKSKIKIKKWLGIPNISAYEKYIADWHSFTKKISAIIDDGDDNYSKQINMTVLKLFFADGYDTKRDFYEQFYIRLEKIKQIFSVL